MQNIQQRESYVVRRGLEKLPVDLRAFSDHPGRIESLALLISPVAASSYEQRYAQAAAADLLTSILSFTCEYGAPHELHLGTAYKLCHLVTDSRENALDLIFKQVEQGVMYDKAQHAWKPNPNLVPAPFCFSCQRYRSFKRYTSPTQRAAAAQYAISRLTEVAEAPADSFLVDIEALYPPNCASVEGSSAHPL